MGSGVEWWLFYLLMLLLYVALYACIGVRLPLWRVFMLGVVIAGFQILERYR